MEAMFNQEYTPLEYFAFVFTVASLLLLAYFFLKHIREITRFVWQALRKMVLEWLGLISAAIALVIILPVILIAKLRSGETPVLHTKRLLLRQLKPSDDRAILTLRSDPEVNRYIDRPLSVTLEEAQQFIQKITDGIAKGESVYWGVARLPEEELIGTICLWNFSEEKISAEVGYELLPAFQGRGYMQEALARVIEYGFQELALQEITACVHTENEASIRLLEKFNFARTGLHGEKEIVYTLINPG